MSTTTNPKTTYTLEALRLVGHLGRATTENDTQHYLRTVFELRKLCDTAIANLTFRFRDPDEGVSDEEL